MYIVVNVFINLQLMSDKSTVCVLYVNNFNLTLILDRVWGININNKEKIKRKENKWWWKSLYLALYCKWKHVKRELLVHTSVQKQKENLYATIINLIVCRADVVSLGGQPKGFSSGKDGLVVISTLPNNEVYIISHSL